MSFRRYVATTVREGLDRVRRELGDDAVILSNKRLGPGRIEIVAAASDSMQALVEEADRPNATPRQSAAARERARPDEQSQSESFQDFIRRQAPAAAPHARQEPQEAPPRARPRRAPSPRRRALAWRCTTRWPGRTLSPRPQPHPKRYWHTRWRHRRCSASAPHATPRCPPRRSPERHHRLRSTLVRPRRLRLKPRRRARRHRLRQTAPRSVRLRHRLRQTAPRSVRRRQRRRPTAPRPVRPRPQLPKRPRHRSRHRHPSRCRRWPLCRKSVRSQTPRWTTPG